jgi:hypothetical protein
LRGQKVLAREKAGGEKATVPEEWERKWVEFYGPPSPEQDGLRNAFLRDCKEIGTFVSGRRRRIRSN